MDLELVKKLNPEIFDRQVMLRAFIIVNGPSFAEIGRRLGLSGGRVSQILRAETVPVDCFKKLKKMGIPPYLLPRGKNRPTGPVPKSGRS